MRLARVVIGLALLAGGLYIIIGEHFAGTSADATINARLYVVRAPIEGRVTLAVRSIGARVNPGELVADITDERFDTARLLNLERDRDNQQIELKRIAEQRAALSQARTGFDAQSIDYQRGRIRQIEARIAETRAAQDAAAARLRQADADFKRANELNVRGVQTVANLDRARATYDVAQQDVVSAQQRINYFETELVSARDGVFIGESYNDAPFSTQRIRELDLRLAELSVEEQQVKARTAQFDRQIDAERLRVNRLTSAALNARVPGVAWDFLVDDGEFARRGQDLIKVVDCNSLIVTAGVSEALYDSLSIGAPAQFRLFGDERIFDGTITRLGGSGASSLYANLAVGPSPQHLQRFDVTVTIPELAEHPDLGCAIGRTGRVIFSSGPIARLRRLLARYGV
ncbi:HlyD family efflux transporter periplasmic adaptor subunit [Bradyrhizobium sp. 180]|uniref:HlyD family secretion protein n=1 Tax=Bradyrhizobium sp. 180 TaxID=2782650 RepID=UPI001FFA05E9|nr:HlyD family efflux transporter periplasmic adaptor subunit [Bradyrhizobium sp. 180]MCK1493317.1 HlyD family efflux transporter periplasmic adaptor subunit [Bradyrhizobium sp. 180]